MKIRISHLRRIIRESILSEISDRLLDTTIAERFDEPEFASPAEFVRNKVENDERTYDVVELQVMARRHMVERNPGLYRKLKTLPQPSKKDIDDTHFEILLALEEMQGSGKAPADFDLVYVPRVADRTFRGATSNPHGSHPFAGQGGGGSGFGSEFGSHVGGFTAMGGGPGAVGGRRAFDPKIDLPMGGGRRK